MSIPDEGSTLADVEEYNNRDSSKRWYQKDIFDLPNIGNLPDWYSDARFAQQYFTGTNPTTIRQAGEWTKIFLDAATDPKDGQMKAKISQRAAESPRDYSYFRAAAGTNDFRCEFKETYQEGGKKKERQAYRYALSSVCLFNLADNGILEPLAIIIDWRGSADKSVFIYNKELNPKHVYQAWSREMRAPVAEQGANLGSFPELRTFEALVDCVTMRIHIASPQHTSVNYLQNYYQAFVVNKPPALYRDQLLGYGEADLVAALPMNHPHEWLLASRIPYLLSFKPGDKESLIIYAASKYHVYKYKKSEKEQKIKEAAARFYEALARSESEFKTYAEATDDQTITYDVLSPSWNAVSILI
ncbi:hypothetical protein PG994_002438 [Apiospora phragmitis]|uniref:Manganese lipoxygenase n=1 Tax=Apiospora phragmitis TaxID=2905665 RepID=A0ABR1WWC1_9PEZI